MLKLLIKLKNLPLEKQIEYYLGKHQLPNLEWQPKIPNSWDIPTRPNIILCSPTSHDTTITLKEGVPYTFNNLGYRSNFDFDLDKLKNKNIVLILGDSDTFGRGVYFDDIYSSKIQKSVDYCVLNLGVCSVSPDAITRIGIQSMLALGSAIKHVCVLWPIFSLREFVSKTFKSGVHTLQTDNIPYANWWDHIDWVSNNYNYQKNRILLERTALSVGAQFHDLIINRNDKSVPTTFYPMDGGRFTELSTETHHAVANYFLRKINNQPSLYQELTQS